MAKISKTNIVDGQTIQADHPIRIIDALRGESNNDIYISGSLIVTGSTNIKGTASGDHFFGNGSGITGVISASYAESASVAVSSSWAENNYWTASGGEIHRMGNVGIGTTNPTEKLHLYGDGREYVKVKSTGTSNDWAAVMCENNANAQGSLTVYSSDYTTTLFGTPRANFATLISVGASSEGLMVGTLVNKPIIIGTNSSERMRITNDGNVGIGTNNPSNDLTLHSDTKNMYLGIDSGDANQTQIRMYKTGSLNWAILCPSTAGYRTDLNFYAGGVNANTTRVVFKNDGKVGIGTTDPQTKLHVSGNISGSYITGKKCGVYAYLSQSTTTQMPTADTFYALSGSFVNVPIEDFHLGTDAIVYDGTKTQYFEIDFHASLAGNANGTTVVLGIKKNGVLCEGSQMGMYLKTADEMYNIDGTCVTEISQNDTIQLVGKSSATDGEITFHYYTTTISEFFD